MKLYQHITSIQKSDEDEMWFETFCIHCIDESISEPFELLPNFDTDNFVKHLEEKHKEYL